jgi:hypothetical protein
VNDFDRRILGTETVGELLDMRAAANATAKAVERLAGAFEQRCKDDNDRWDAVRSDIGELHGRINDLPAVIDAKVKAHADACSEDLAPVVQTFNDAEAVRRYAGRQMRPILYLVVAAAIVALAVLLATGQKDAAAIVGTVFGVATPFALVLLNRK